MITFSANASVTWTTLNGLPTGSIRRILIDIRSVVMRRQLFEEAGNVRGKFVHFDVHQSRFVNAQGELIGTVGCARDITERKTVEMQVQHLAHHDVLTDLPNRVLLSARMEQSLALARRERSMLALLFIDLDRLKPVNDALGHDAGDLLLKEVASRLQAVLVRETDTAARFGGRVRGLAAAH